MILMTFDTLSIEYFNKRDFLIWILNIFYYILCSIGMIVAVILGVVVGIILLIICCCCVCSNACSACCNCGRAMVKRPKTKKSKQDKKKRKPKHRLMPGVEVSTIIILQLIRVMYYQPCFIVIWFDPFCVLVCPSWSG